MSTGYEKIRFIGYALPTTPAKLISIGDPNGPGAVAGSYLADCDVQTDMRDRIAIMKNAVETAKRQLPADETSVINVFVAPEFYFHGTAGPYIYSTPEDDPVVALRQELARTFNAAEYPNWTFICGTAVTTMLKDVHNVYDSNSVTTRNRVVENLAEQWRSSFGPLKGVIFDMLVDFIKNCHSYPNCEVRNRSVIVSNVPIRTPETDNPTSVMTTEKYYVSNEDFLLYDVDGREVITEQMTAYKPIDLSIGDAKRSPFDEYAIFRQNGIDPGNPIATSVMDYGVEICLDHSDTRLRRSINNEPSLIGGIHIQLIPSCGMQISLPNVAADRDGFVFNCDGQYALTAPVQEKDGINGVKCLFANYRQDHEESDYAAHTQLARVRNPATGGDPNAEGSTNATFWTLDATNLAKFTVDAPRTLSRYFAGGPGEIHIYGLKEGFALYPSQSPDVGRERV